MLSTPFSEMGKFFPEYSACPSFQSLRDETQGILWRVFKENMHVIRILYLGANTIWSDSSDTVCLSWRSSIF